MIMEIISRMYLRRMVVDNAESYLSSKKSQCYFEEDETIAPTRGTVCAHVFRMLTLLNIGTLVFVKE